MKGKTFLLCLLALGLYAPEGFGAASGSTISLGGVSATLGGTGGKEEMALALKILLGLTVLSLAPALLVSMTSFVRIIIVLSMLRHALGMQETPPNTVLISLALFLTLFTMTPVFDQMGARAFGPFMGGKLSAERAFEEGMKPMREFMVRQTREQDFSLMVELSKKPMPETVEGISNTQLYLASESGSIYRSDDVMVSWIKEDLESRPEVRLFVADFSEADFLAHAYGSTSAQYKDALRRTDEAAADRRLSQLATDANPVVADLDALKPTARSGRLSRLVREPSRKDHRAQRVRRPSARVAHLGAHLQPAEHVPGRKSVPDAVGDHHDFDLVRAGERRSHFRRTPDHRGVAEHREVVAMVRGTSGFDDRHVARLARRIREAGLLVLRERVLHGLRNDLLRDRREVELMTPAARRFGREPGICEDGMRRARGVLTGADDSALLDVARDAVDAVATGCDGRRLFGIAGRRVATATEREGLHRVRALKNGVFPRLAMERRAPLCRDVRVALHALLAPQFRTK